MKKPGQIFFRYLEHKDQQTILMGYIQASEGKASVKDILDF